MIELQVIAVRKEGLATEYRLSPDPVIIGAMDSHYEEKLHLTLPESWAGRTVRVTFTPEMCEGVGFIMDADDRCVPITAAFSGAAPRGVITVEAYEVDETDGETVTHRTFARDVRYRAIPHAAPGEPPEDITPTQFEQFIANVTAATKDNADAAAKSAEGASQYADEAEGFATAAGTSKTAAEEAAQTAAQHKQAAEDAVATAAQSETDAQKAAEAALAAQKAAEGAAAGAASSAGTASSGAAAAVNAQSLAQQAQSKAEDARDAAASSAQKAADSEFAATNAAGTLMSVADDTANAIVLEASGSVVQIAAASRTLKELLVNIDPTLDGRTGTMVTVATDDAEMSYAMDFGKVVYGGTYNWKTGELTETWQAFVFDGTEGWVEAGGKTDSMLPVCFNGDALNIARKNTAVCDRYTRSESDGEVGQFWISADALYNVRFRVNRESFDDVDAWIAHLKAQHDAGTPVVLVAEVVEPTTAALAATEMPRSVAPSCSIAATTGDVSLAYVADTKAYVDENSGAGPATEPEVFIAEHSVTTYEEIKAAYDAGKIVLCKYYSYTGYLFVFNAGANYALFYTHEADDCLYKIVCHATQGWTNTRYAHASKEYVDEKVASLELVSIVTELPETGVENKTYFVAKTDGSGMDLYDEYMWINGAWEYIGTKQIEIDLTEYVKNTDYASVGKCGIVKTAATYDDGIYINTAGAMSLCTASTANIDDRKTKRPITPTNLDYAVKVGITTNTNELTTDEQAAARAWLGAIGATDYASEDVAGVAKTTYRYGIVTDSNGFLTIYPATTAHIDGKSVKNPITPSNLDYAIKVGLTTNAETLTAEEKAAVQKWLGMTMATNEAKPWTVVQRSTDGVIYVGTPTANNHATTKAYVDGLAVARNKGIVAFTDDGTQEALAWAYNLQGNSIARRLGNGTLWVATPDVDNAAANKGYVDGLIAELQAQIDALKG